MSVYNISRRDFNSLLGVSLIGGPLLSGCDESQKGVANVVNLRQEWFAYSGFSGEVLAAKKYAPNFGITLNVEAGSETVDSIKSVLSGQDDMGVASGDLVVEAIAGGAPLIAIGVINDTSPTCFISRKASGITTLRDFVGKRVGILPGTNTARIYQLLMQRNNIDRRLVQEVDVPEDLHTFILGQYDVRPAFIYDEPVTLARANIPINILKPQDYGVKFVGTVYFTRRDVVEKNGPVIVNVLRSLILGWRDIASPAGRKEAIAVLKADFPEIDVGKETASLESGAPLFLGPAGSNRPLEVTTAHWLDTIHGLEELGQIKTGAIDLSLVWDATLLSKAYGLINERS